MANKVWKGIGVLTAGGIGTLLGTILQYFNINGIILSACISFSGVMMYILADYLYLKIVKGEEK